jgi:hypothetical protein
MRNRNHQLAIEAVLVLVLAWLAGRQAWQLAVAPRQAEVAALESELADLRDNKAWGSSLRARLAASEAAYPQRVAALRDIDGYFLHDENDRLRILDSWDKLVKQAANLRAQSEATGSRTTQLTFRTQEPIAEELNDLRRRFSKLYPRDELATWKAPPDSISVVRLDERLRLTGPYPEVFAFLQKIQADTLFYEVTHLSMRQDGAAPDDPVQAAITISAAMFRDRPRDR